MLPLSWFEYALSQPGVILHDGLALCSGRIRCSLTTAGRRHKRSPTSCRGRSLSPDCLRQPAMPLEMAGMGLLGRGSAAYLPIGAVMMTDEIHDVLVEGSRKFGMFGHGFTYSGHPVPAAVALETQRIYESDGIGRHVKAVSPHFQRRLAALADHPLVGEARGIGLIGAVELVRDKGKRENFDPAAKVAPWVVARAMEHGLIVRSLVNDTVAFCPPLIITDHQIDDMFDAMTLALDDAVKHIGETL